MSEKNTADLNDENKQDEEINKEAEYDADEIFKSMSDEELIAWAENFIEHAPQIFEQIGIPLNKLEEFKAKVETFAASCEKTKQAEANLERAKEAEKQSLERLDDALAKASEQKGKPIMLPFFNVPKKYNSQ